MWPACLLWRPTKASHSILRAFKFRNPAVEEAYEAQRRGLRFTVVAAYFAFSCCITSLHCLSFMGNAVMPWSFWCLLAVLLLQATALLMFSTVKVMRRRVVVFHAVVVTASVMTFNYITRLYAENWLGIMVQRLEQEFPPPLVEGTRGLLAIVFGNQSRAATTISCHFHVISLTFMGYNHTTIPVWTLFLISSITSSMLDPHGHGLYTALYSCELLLMIMPYPVLGLCIEVLQRRNFHAQQELIRELEISQMAESMLNNTVKNVLADAVANIQEFLHSGCHAPNSLLQETLTTLSRGMRSCRHRQAFLALVSATYEPRLLPVSLRDFGAELVAGRAVAGDFAEGQVLLDPLLCSLVLENAIAQAFQHGEAEPDVRVKIYEQSGLEGAALLALRVAQAVFEVSFVAREEDARRLTGTEALPLRADAPPAHYMTQRHLKLAADAHDMTVQWFRAAERVVFRGTCRVRVTEPPAQAEPPPSSLLEAFPAGLTFYVIDDSTAARRVLASCITQLAAPAAVHCYGTYPEDVHQFVGAASQDADIVICDQHLDYGDQHYLGTDLVCGLRDGGFRGLLCVRSADMTEHDRELYRAAGAHCMFGKEEPTKEVVNAIKAAYVELKALDHPELVVSSPFAMSHSSSVLFPAALPVLEAGQRLGWDAGPQ